MAYKSLKHKVSTRGIPPDSFLDELVSWGGPANEEIFAPNQNHDIYDNVVAALGPWEGIEHRRAVLLEVMRVLAGFESSWNWQEGVDQNTEEPTKPETLEAGAWQVSSNSMRFGQELRSLVLIRAHGDDPKTFRTAMQNDHTLAMEYIARLLRHTVAANGPVLRHEIDRWLRRDAVDEFRTLWGEHQ